MKRTRLIIAAMAASLLAVSCSVKEDRTGCPCWLDIYMSNAADFSRNVYLTGWDASGGNLYRESVSLDEFPDFYETTVPKGFITSCGLLGFTGSRIEGDNYTIPYGEECDRIYASSNPDVDCTGEHGEDRLDIHKHHAMLYMQCSYGPLLKGTLSYRVVGQVNGISLLDLRPKAGQFSAFAKLNENGYWEVCLPRQIDNGLVLEIQADGQPYLNVALGELIAGIGYSWATRDLDDIFVKIDAGGWEDTKETPSVSISIRDWSEDHFTFRI